MRRSLTKQERLRSRQEIDRVFASGESRSCPGMRLVFCTNALDTCRFAVIAARGHRTAVERNRTKRLARETFRLNKTDIKPGFDFVIICYPGDYRYADRNEQFLKLLSKAGVLSTQEP